MLQLDVVEHQALFIELGDALMKRELWEKALECYASIQECDDVRPFTGWELVELILRLMTISI